MSFVWIFSGIQHWNVSPLWTAARMVGACNTLHPDFFILKLLSSPLISQKLIRNPWECSSCVSGLVVKRRMSVLGKISIFSVWVYVQGAILKTSPKLVRFHSRPICLVLVKILNCFSWFHEARCLGYILLSACRLRYLYSTPTHRLCSSASRLRFRVSCSWVQYIGIEWYSREEVFRIRTYMLIHPITRGRWVGIVLFQATMTGWKFRK
jgi:hypothetical protein